VKTAKLAIQLASAEDAPEIAALSRDEIESGLGWSWTAERVRHAIRDRATNVAVARDTGGRLAGFGIMIYRDDAAHLSLFAVDAAHRRQGVGSALLGWLEDVARTAGIPRIGVECRRDNAAARNFYGDLGYHEIAIARGYYRGREDAVRLEKWLVAPVA
jgi:[ribosomal protein S18]-alanine N-acetyltransferase